MYSLPRSKRIALFFKKKKKTHSRGPRNKARIGPKKYDVHTAKSASREAVEGKAKLTPKPS